MGFYKINQGDFMKDYKRNFTAEHDAYLARRILATVLIASAVAWGAATIGEIVLDNHLLRVELVQNLAVSDDAADYMVTHGAGIIFSDQDLE